ncbi:MAG: terminase [Kofleriaceae bacterium]|nr:terminase [Kofleriaceae bacterium]
MRNNLLSWQWQGYSVAHRDRRNLLLHLFTAPIFAAGLAMSLAAPLFAGWLALPGIAAMLAVLVVQGRGHRDEASAPVPFTGPADFVTRFVAEQLVTFPRFVLSGGFRRAWHATTTV